MFAVNNLARFTVHSCAEVCIGVDRVFAYLNGSTESGITITKEKGIECVVYTFAHLAGEDNGMKSVTGVVMYLGRNLIYW